MSRWIDAEYCEDFFDRWESRVKNAEPVTIDVVQNTRTLLRDAPSIDIVFCNECEFENTRKCPPHRMGLIHDASDYCSYGIRKTDGVDKHDEAVEALGHLIKRMKGADDEVH